MTTRIKVLLIALFALFVGLSYTTTSGAKEHLSPRELQRKAIDTIREMEKQTQPEKYSVEYTDKEWQEKLTPEEYRILRLKGTERPFMNKYNNFKKEGVFACSGCGTELFSSDHKFDSGTGWPSYYDQIAEDRVGSISDHSHGMVRTEVVCNTCGGHLGHVFPDGPNPTGLRYCINSASLDFKSAE